ncbi:MAG: cobalt/nickel transport system permease protein [Nocardioidaceae bacterium]|jgi:cobalt ECF transporter T component CbiQ|nr:cobalt/nickel transport system permease protein [Nocardioidaceae bacterium]
MADADTGTTTPGWLLTTPVAMCPCGCVGKRRKVSFVQKTLTDGSALLRQAMFTDDLARQPGLLQRLDPRAKLIGMFVLLVAAALVHNIATLAVMYLGTLLVASRSGLPFGFFVKRVWLFVPLFTLVIVLPATLSIVTSGDVVVQLWTWHGEPQGLTAQGLISAALVVSRVAVSISLVVMVTLTTPWTKLLAALRSLGVPRIFILVIGMAYRYIFLLLESVTEMYEARSSRTVGAVRHDRHARAFVSASAGALLSKANHLSEEVHQAMVARGYRGHARVLDLRAIGLVDVMAIAVTVLLAVVVVGGDRLLGW